MTRTRVAVLAAGGLLLGSVLLPGSSAAEPRNTPAAARAGIRLVPEDATCAPQQLNTSLTPSSSDAGPDVQRIIKRGKLIAGIDTNSYLWGFRNPTDGSLQGFDIDLVHALAKSILGNADAVEFLAVPTANRVSALQQGQVDVVVRTMTISCDRLSQVAFSVPYFNAGQEIVVPKSSSITGFNDTLKGKKVCAATGSTAADMLKDPAKNHGETVFPVANQLDCLVQMQLGNVDATITDNALGAGQVAQDPTIHLVGGPLDQEVYGVAMKLGSDDLVRRVNYVLKDYFTGQWTAEYQRWLTPLGSTPPPAPVPHFAN
ncbi:glutamate ABC transporter substrate-binding protein [Streptacidiphilus sp. N1-12]|uniref:Glutamate ABC transporter substrate-binding protein n=2 Tax=Streptacidiphilus alkalitolerans TaxID=3342712 RepID=A0ABV6WU32_9ACTN